MKRVLIIDDVRHESSTAVLPSLAISLVRFFTLLLNIIM